MQRQSDNEQRRDEMRMMHQQQTMMMNSFSKMVNVNQFANSSNSFIPINNAPPVLQNMNTDDTSNVNVESSDDDSDDEVSKKQEFELFQFSLPSNYINICNVNPISNHIEPFPNISFASSLNADMYVFLI